jgi:hypothetical protein
MSTCPPCPAAAIRAARCTSRPTYPSSVTSAVPVCSPIRTRIGPAASACVASAAHASAPRAVGNATKNASPWVSTSTPPWRAAAARNTRRCSARAALYLSTPSSPSRRVDPSTSVNRKVTVPEGGPRIDVETSSRACSLAVSGAALARPEYGAVKGRSTQGLPSTHLSSPGRSSAPGASSPHPGPSSAPPRGALADRPSLPPQRPPTYPDGGSAWAIQTCRLSPANGRARRPRGQDSAAPFGEVHSIAVDETWELKRSWISGPMWPCAPTALRRPIRRASDSQSFPVRGPNQDGTRQIDALATSSIPVGWAALSGPARRFVRGPGARQACVAA